MVHNLREKKDACAPGIANTRNELQALPKSLLTYTPFIKPRTCMQAARNAYLTYFQFRYHIPAPGAQEQKPRGGGGGGRGLGETSIKGRHQVNVLPQKC